MHTYKGYHDMHEHAEQTAWFTIYGLKWKIYNYPFRSMQGHYITFLKVPVQSQRFTRQQAFVWYSIDLTNASCWMSRAQILNLSKGVAIDTVYSSNAAQRENIVQLQQPIHGTLLTYYNYYHFLDLFFTFFWATDTLSRTEKKRCPETTIIYSTARYIAFCSVAHWKASSTASWEWCLVKFTFYPVCPWKMVA